MHMHIVHVPPSTTMATMMMSVSVALDMLGFGGPGGGPPYAGPRGGYACCGGPYAGPGPYAPGGARPAWLV
jgi:hypothetical protein